MQHKIIDDTEHYSTAISLFREKNIVDITLLAEASESAQFELLTEALHSLDHHKNKTLIRYMAQLALRLEYYDTAIIYLLKLLPQAKRKSAAWVTKQLGLAFWGKKAHSLALDYFKLASDLNPTDGDVHNYLGKLYYKTDELDLSLSHFQKVIDLTGGNGHLHRQIGFVHIKKSDYSTAAKYFKKAIELSPEQGLSYYGYGLALFRLGAYRSAMKKFHTLFQDNKLMDKAGYGIALVQMARRGYHAGKAKLQEIPWYDPRTRYIENITLAGTISAHAHEQALLRNVDLEVIRTSSNIGIIKDNIAKLYPFIGTRWSRYEVLFDMRNNATITVINYTPTRTKEKDRSGTYFIWFKRMAKVLRRTRNTRRNRRRP